MASRTALAIGIVCFILGWAPASQASETSQASEAFVDGCAVLLQLDGAAPTGVPLSVQYQALMCENMIVATVGLAQGSGRPAVNEQPICVTEDASVGDVARAIVTRRHEILDDHPSITPAGVVLAGLVAAYPCDGSD